MTYLQSQDDDKMRDYIEEDRLYEDEIGQPYDFGERIIPESEQLEDYMEDDATASDAAIDSADTGIDQTDFRESLARDDDIDLSQLDDDTDASQQNKASRIIL